MLSGKGVGPASLSFRPRCGRELGGSGRIARGLRWLHRRARSSPRVWALICRHHARYLRCTALGKPWCRCQGRTAALRPVRAARRPAARVLGRALRVACLVAGRTAAAARSAALGERGDRRRVPRPGAGHRELGELSFGVPAAITVCDLQRAAATGQARNCLVDTHTRAQIGAHGWCLCWQLSS